MKNISNHGFVLRQQKTKIIITLCVTHSALLLLVSDILWTREWIELTVGGLKEKNKVRFNSIIYRLQGIFTNRVEK